MFGVLKYLNENREKVLFTPDSDEEEAPAVFEDDPASGATFTREQVLDFVPLGGMAPSRRGLLLRPRPA
jgi:hypothetical protein